MKQDTDHVILIRCENYTVINGHQPGKVSHKIISKGIHGLSNRTMSIANPSCCMGNYITTISRNCSYKHIVELYG